MPQKNQNSAQAQKKKLIETSSAWTPWQSLKKKPNSWKYSTIISLFVFSLVFWGIIMYFFTWTSQNKQVDISTFVSSYKSGKYSKIEIKDNIITWIPIDNSVISNPLFASQKNQVAKEFSVLPLTDSLKDIGIDISAPLNSVSIIDTTSLHFWSDLAPTIFGTIFFLLLFVFLMSKMMSGAGGGPMGFVKNKAKRYEPTQWKILFEDVAGSLEEKQDLQEFVDFLKNPAKYKKLWAKIPRWVLMVGPPGTGKTLLARAVAGESNVPFYSISGSEFVEMFVWVGAARVRDLFSEAKAHAPSIIFIDEIDAIWKKRSTGFGGGHDEREQTLNQILTEMDGFDNLTNIIVMAATNRADVLDKALLRPGRFDRKVTISLPKLDDRHAILLVHSKNKPMDTDVDLKKIAALTIGFSWAELESLLNEAAILAGRENSRVITQHMLQVSIEKVILWNTKKSHVMTDFEVKLTAYHEVWHALVAKMTKHADPVHKISIISRGSAGWVTWYLPEKDTSYTTRAQMLDKLLTLYGWRASEEIFFGRDYITTGASSDIERATHIAREMVTTYWFVDEIWLENLSWASFDDDGSDGRKVLSDETKQLIDIHVRKLLTNAYDQAKKIILSHKDLHEKISLVLMKKQEMLQDEFDSFFEDIKIPEKVVL